MRPRAVLRHSKETAGKIMGRVDETNPQQTVSAVKGMRISIGEEEIQKGEKGEENNEGKCERCKSEKTEQSCAGDSPDEFVTTSAVYVSIPFKSHVTKLKLKEDHRCLTSVFRFMRNQGSSMEPGSTMRGCWKPTGMISPSRSSTDRRHLMSGFTTSQRTRNQLMIETIATEIRL